MSRIGKLPVSIPNGVTITVDNGVITVAGPKGSLTLVSLPEVNITIEDGKATLTRINDEKIAKSRHGLMRALVANMVKGVTEGFEKKLEVNGVGFRVKGGGQDIEMSLGFSHPVKYHATDSVNLGVEKNIITVSGISKQQVGQAAAEIRALKKPEPYKGKGIKYVDETIIRKAGKTGAK